jgi:hypothetical protein
MCAVDRHQRAPCDPGRQSRRGTVLSVGEAAGPIGEALVLDPHRFGIDAPVAGVPGDVGEMDELDDLAVARDHVVRRRMCARVRQPLHRAPECAFGDVDDDLLDRPRRPVRLREVALALEPDDGRARRRACTGNRHEEARGRDRRGEDVRLS